MERIKFLSVAIGVLLGIGYMSIFKLADSDFENAALGQHTMHYYTVDQAEKVIHYSPKADLTEFIGNVQPHLTNKKLLYLGNSQSHSINQMRSGDNTMSGYLFNDLYELGYTFLTASAPNASLQEHYLMYNLLDSSLSGIDALILPVFMDDLRETGIRKAYFKSFANYRLSANNKLSDDINNQLASFKEISDIDTTAVVNEEDFGALKETTQDIVERKINRVLNDNFTFWKNRKDIRGAYFTTLYRARNTLFNISSQTTRRMISSRYKKNMEAFHLIVEQAKQSGTEVIVIIPPLRKDIKYPYEITEYENFKLETKNYCEENKLTYLDFDHIVPGKYWGYSAPTQLFHEQDYDFMHFQAAGHRILADSLKPYLLKEL